MFKLYICMPTGIIKYLYIISNASIANAMVTNFVAYMNTTYTANIFNEFHNNQCFTVYTFGLQFKLQCKPIEHFVLDKYTYTEGLQKWIQNDCAMSCSMTTANSGVSIHQGQ